MGWLNKAKSSGGSFEGVISDYVLSNKFPFGNDDDDDEAKDDGKKSIYMLLDITKDGNEEPEQRAFWFGSGKFLKITEKGKVLVSTNDDGVPGIYEDGEVYAFLDTLERAGFPTDTRFPDPEETRTLDFRGMIGWRVRITFVKDTERQMEVGRARLGGRAKTATDAQIFEAGKRTVTKGKHKGKPFDLTRWEVTKVFDGPSPRSGSAKANGQATGDEDTPRDGDEATITNKQADIFLRALLDGAKNNTLKKSDLPLSITRAARAEKLDGSEANALRSKINDDGYLEGAAERGVIEYNQKKQTLTLEA